RGEEEDGVERIAGGGLEECVEAVDLRGEDALEVLRTLVLEPAVGEHARAVDDGRERAERGARLGKRSGERLAVAHVDRRVASLGADEREVGESGSDLARRLD